MKYKFLPIPQQEHIIPTFKLIIKWEHGDADGSNESTHSFDSSEKDQFIQYLDFFNELKKRSYEYRNSERGRDIYKEIAVKHFGENVETYGLIESDITYSDGWAVVDDIDVEINGVPNDWIDLSSADEITLPAIGSIVERTTYNTNRIDNSRWVPKDSDYNKLDISVKVNSISIGNVYSNCIYYECHGEVVDSSYKELIGSLCRWTKKGIDFENDLINNFF